MVNSLSLGRLANISAALPCAAIFSGGRNLIASPACQFGLPPGPAVAREIVFSHFPPVRLACDSALAVMDLPQPEKTALVAPADPKIFKSVRRSVVALCSDMDSTPRVFSRRLVRGFSICSLKPYGRPIQTPLIRVSQAVEPRGFCEVRSWYIKVLQHCQRKVRTQSENFRFSAE